MRRQILLDAAIVVMATFVSLLILGICVSCCQAPAENRDPELEQQINEPQVKEEAQDFTVSPTEAEAATVKPTGANVILAPFLGKDLGWLDYFYPAGLDLCVDGYLAWRDNYPEGWSDLIRYGRAIQVGDQANLPPVSLPFDMEQAARIAYDGYRWDCWVYKRCPTSDYCGQGLHWVRFLWGRGREAWPALAILELESTYGLASGSNDMGILDKRFTPGNVYNYPDYLDHHQAKSLGRISNALPDIMAVYNDHEPYRETFYWLVNQMRNYWP